jgi:hypothetical protein
MVTTATQYWRNWTKGRDKRAPEKQQGKPRRHKKNFYIKHKLSGHYNDKLSGNYMSTTARSVTIDDDDEIIEEKRRINGPDGTMERVS